MSSEVFNISIINLTLEILDGCFSYDFALDPVCFNRLAFWEGQLSFAVKSIQKQLAVINESILKVQLSFDNDSIFANPFECCSVLKLPLSVPCEKIFIWSLMLRRLIFYKWTVVFLIC